jgi:GNAT superfamily N-acetyltransferase
MDVRIARLTVADAHAAALVHRTSFDDRLPWLAGLHTPEEDDVFYRDVVLAHNEVSGAFDGSALVGIVAVRPGWVDQLYVLPTHQRRGIGAALLDVAKCRRSRLDLWTFQRNTPARRFYERHGFVAVEETDGAGNEEHEPDVRYRWTA